MLPAGAAPVKGRILVLPSSMTQAMDAAAVAPKLLPFKYVGGDPAIDLVNTVDWTVRGLEEDRLTSFDRLIEWAQGGEIISARTAAALRARARAHPREAALAHKAALRTRETLWRLFSALARGEAVAGPLLDFNTLLSKALEHMRVSPVREKRGAGRTLELSWGDLGDSLEGVLWPVLWSAASLLVSDESDRIRVCGGLDCGWMYVDRSRNGLRRWCQMETCGTREKTRRRYQRD
jgi:predicted RNA-binding Zn ribbon-like protein